MATQHLVEGHLLNFMTSVPEQDGKRKHLASVWLITDSQDTLAKSLCGEVFQIIVEVSPKGGYFLEKGTQESEEEMGWCQFIPPNSVHLLKNISHVGVPPVFLV